MPRLVPAGGKSISRKRRRKSQGVTGGVTEVHGVFLEFTIHGVGQLERPDLTTKSVASERPRVLLGTVLRKHALDLIPQIARLCGRHNLRTRLDTS